MDRGAWSVIVYRVAKSQTTELMMLLLSQTAQHLERSLSPMAQAMALSRRPHSWMQVALWLLRS